MSAYTWWLQCNACGWRLEDEAATVPKCPECGEPLHIHSHGGRQSRFSPVPLDG